MMAVVALGAATTLTRASGSPDDPLDRGEAGHERRERSRLEVDRVEPGGLGGLLGAGTDRVERGERLAGAERPGQRVDRVSLVVDDVQRAAGPVGPADVVNSGGHAPVSER